MVSGQPFLIGDSIVGMDLNHYVLFLLIYTEEFLCLSTYVGPNVLKSLSCGIAFTKFYFC